MAVKRQKNQSKRFIEAAKENATDLDESAFQKVVQEVAKPVLPEKQAKSDKQAKKEK